MHMINHHLMAGQFNLEFKSLNMDFDFPLSFLLFQVQNPYEAMPHLLACLPAVTNSRSIGW